MQTKHSICAKALFQVAFILLLAMPASAQKAAGGPEKQPEFPGGMPALIDYMVQNIRYPEGAKKSGATGMVVAKFTVGKDGAVSKITTLSEASQNPREDFVLESVRVIRAMPRWIPAESEGKLVAAEVTLPIKFALDGKKP